MPPIPPIPIHSNDPISPDATTTSPSNPTAAKPDGITPQTAAGGPTPSRTIPTSIPATTTSDPANPPPPQPGARPVPQPTGTTNPDDSPPPPQPGSSPVKSSNITATHTTTETRFMPQGMPSQFQVPAPSDGQLPTRSTTISQNLGPGPTTLNLGPANPNPSVYQHEAMNTRVDGGNLDHPPGYVQNPDPTKYPTYTPHMAQNSTTSEEDASSGGVTDSAWNLLSKAGEALKKGEEAAWKAARGK